MKTYNLELTIEEMMLIESALRKQADRSNNVPTKVNVSPYPKGKMLKGEELSMRYIEVANMISDNLRLTTL